MQPKVQQMQDNIAERPCLAVSTLGQSKDGHAEVKIKPEQDPAPLAEQRAVESVRPPSEPETLQKPLP